MYSRGKIFKFVLLAIAGIFLLTYIVYELWNWLMPELFNLSHINFWQAMGLLVLTKLLFSGFRGGWHGKWNHKSKYWKQRMEAKMSTMTAEQKEKFKQELARCCHVDWDEKPE